MTNDAKLTMDDVTTLTHPKAGIKVKVFRGTPHQWFATWSNEPQVEWLGSEKKAKDLVARCKREGWT